MSIGRRSALAVVGWIVVAVLAGSSSAFFRQEPVSDPLKEGWVVHQWDDLVDKTRETGNPWLQFLDAKSLQTGVYILAAAAVDKQQPHARDEVYYVVRGKASLRIGTKEHPVQAGSFAFVHAGVPHAFHDITEELQVLVFFSAATPSPLTAPSPRSSLKKP